MSTQSFQRGDPERDPVASTEALPELTKEQRGAESILLFLSQQPDFTLEHPDVVTHLRDRVHLVDKEDITHKEWAPIIKMVFTAIPIVRVEKSKPQLTRPDRAVLDPDMLELHVAQPYVTDRVLEAKRSAMQAIDVTLPQFTDAEISIRALHTTKELPA